MAVSQFYGLGDQFRRRNRKGNRSLAIGLSLGAHVVLGLALVHYAVIGKVQAPLALPEKPIRTEIFRFTPPRSKADPAPPHQTLKLHIPQTIQDNPITTLPPAVEGPPVETTGPVTVPTAPSSTGTGQGTSSGPVVAVIQTPPPARPRTITSPSWVRQPTRAQLDQAYPARALEASIRGTATINCQILASGFVRDCQITGETPRGEGFGAAAVQLSRYFMLNPRAEDGRAVEGSRVEIPLTFQPQG